MIHVLEAVAELYQKIEKYSDDYLNQLMIVKLLEQMIEIKYQIELRKEIASQQYQSIINKLNDPNSQTKQ